MHGVPREPRSLPPTLHAGGASGGCGTPATTATTTTATGTTATGTGTPRAAGCRRAGAARRGAQRPPRRPSVSRTRATISVFKKKYFRLAEAYAGQVQRARAVAEAVAALQAPLAPLPQPPAPLAQPVIAEPEQPVEVPVVAAPAIEILPGPRGVLFRVEGYRYARYRTSRGLAHCRCHQYRDGCAARITLSFRDGNPSNLQVSNIRICNYTSSHTCQ